MVPRCEVGGCQLEAIKRCPYCKRRLCDSHRNACSCKRARQEQVQTEQVQTNYQVMKTCARCGTYFPEGEKDRTFEFLGVLPQCLACGRHVCARCRVKRTGFEATYHSQCSCCFCNSPECFPRCPICRSEILTEEPLYQCSKCHVFVCPECTRYQYQETGRADSTPIYRCKKHTGLLSSFRKLDNQQIPSR